jgi:hypothetical protein
MFLGLTLEDSKVGGARLYEVNPESWTQLKGSNEKGI